MSAHQQTQTKAETKQAEMRFEDFDLIPSQNDKNKSLLVDAFRILAWESFKVTNSVSGLNAYETFGEAWKDHKIHSLSLQQIQQLALAKGYSVSYLLKYRTEYYTKRRLRSGNGNESEYSEIPNGYEEKPF